MSDVAMLGVRRRWRPAQQRIADVTVVDIGFANADGTEQFDSGVATADGLPAGRTTTVFAAASAAAPAAFTCSVTGATRF
jgi:hypothetical protein